MCLRILFSRPFGKGRGIRATTRQQRCLPMPKLSYTQLTAFMVFIRMMIQLYYI